MLTKKYFTPTHRSVADSLNAFCTWVYCYKLPTEDLKNTWTWVNIFDIIGYFMIISGCLLYNELIIAHVRDLDHDIKDNIVERSQIDCMTSITTIYYYNDIEILQNAGLSVCVANAPDEIKNICQIVVPSCTDGGVGHLLAQLIENFS